MILKNIKNVFLFLISAVILYIAYPLISNILNLSEYTEMNTIIKISMFVFLIFVGFGTSIIGFVVQNDINLPRSIIASILSIFVYIIVITILTASVPVLDSIIGLFTGTQLGLVTTLIMWGLMITASIGIPIFFYTKNAYK